MPDAAELKLAWRALKGSRLDFTSRPDGSQPLVPGNLIQLIERDARRKRSNVTGYRPAAAAAELAGQGVSQTAAESQVRQAILADFPRFANSWDKYIDHNGYLLELLLLPDADKQLLAAHESLGRLRQLAERTEGSAISFIADTSMTVELAKLAELNARRDETHPAYSLMVQVHRLHPELARAVMLHAKVVPWWVYAA
ncbi:MAG TPA: hypothetical protein ENO21_02560, partial [Firmicutes bacterium]|nr:hypothetical protein [Bacillota bacterium]